MALFPSVGPTEMIVILFLILLVFGAKRLPEMGRSLGQGIKEFKKSISTINDDDEPRKIESDKETK